MFCPRFELFSSVLLTRKIRICKAMNRIIWTEFYIFLQPMTEKILWLRSKVKWDSLIFKSNRQKNQEIQKRLKCLQRKNKVLKNRVVLTKCNNTLKQTLLDKVFKLAVQIRLIKHSWCSRWWCNNNKDKLCKHNRCIGCNLLNQWWSLNQWWEVFNQWLLSLIHKCNSFNNNKQCNKEEWQVLQQWLLQ